MLPNYFVLCYHVVSLIKYGNNFIKLLDVNFEGIFSIKICQRGVQF
jgi:hypothetical protein